MNSLHKVGDYTLVAKIGEGSSAQVYLSKCDKDSNLYAVKVVPNMPMNQDSFESFYNRINSEIVAGSLVHKNVVKMIYALKSENNFYFVFEYCETGSLASYLSENIIPEYYAIRFLKDIVSGYAYIHNKNYIHQDIKLDNILLKFDPETFTTICKIADFGISTRTPEFETSIKKFSDFQGTLPYMAPEKFLNHPSYTYKADIFAIGVAFYYMLFREYPFPIFYNNGQIQKEATLQYFKKATIKINTKCIHKQTKDFLINCLNVNPDKRYNLEAMQKSEILSMGYRELTPFDIENDHLEFSFTS